LNLGLLEAHASFDTCAHIVAANTTTAGVAGTAASPIKGVATAAGFASYIYTCFAGV